MIAETDTTDSSSLILGPMSRDSLALRVAEALKAYIVAESLKPGSQLPSERQLSEAFAVSRNIVREGLSSLVAEGVIVKKPGRGVFIRQLNLESIAVDGQRLLEEQQARYNAVREARAAVELGAIGLIVSRISEEEIRVAERTILNLERLLERGEPFFREDLRFHLTLLRAARNDLLLQWTPMVEEVMRTWSYNIGGATDVLRWSLDKREASRVAAEHRAILEAVRQRNPDLARQLLKEHLQIPNL